MAAVVQVRRLTGAGETATDVTDSSSRFSTSDSPTPGSTNQLVKPAIGVTYSYWSVYRLWAGTSPDVLLNNIKWWVTGANPWTGVTMELATATSYSQASGSIGATGNKLATASYPSISATPAADNAFSFTSASPRAITGSLANPSVGYIGHYVVLQLTVGTSSDSVILSGVTTNWQWDEV